MTCRLLLRKEGVNFHTTAEFEVVKAIKERACYVATDPSREETKETERVRYTLPDGSHLEVSRQATGARLTGEGRQSYRCRGEGMKSSHLEVSRRATSAGLMGRAGRLGTDSVARDSAG